MENAEKQTVQYVDAPIALLIPALDPGPKLLNLLDELDGRWQGPIVLVDDGSGTEPKQSVFAAAQFAAAAGITLCDLDAPFLCSYIPEGTGKFEKGRIYFD